MYSERPIFNSISGFEKSLQNEGFGIEHLRRAAIDLANPTLEVIAQYLRLYAQNLTYDEIMTLHYAFYDFPRNAPQSFFKDRDQQTFGRGFAHLRELIDRVSLEYDSETRRARDDFDEHEVAVCVNEYILLSEAEDELEQLIAHVDAEPDLNRKATLAAQLKKRVLAYISQFHVSFGDDEQDTRSWKDITSRFRWYWDFRLNLHNSTQSGSWYFGEAVYTAHAAIERKKFEKKVQQLAPIDQERFHDLRLQFGAKGAHLLLISEMMDSINRLWGKNRVLAEIPEFSLVPVDVYNSWKSGENIDEMLRPYFEWASLLRNNPYDYREERGESAPYIVRSSAVFSEDGEDRTGAGIYTSVGVERRAQFKQFKQAVLEVFASTKLAGALAYQTSAGVGEEQMGLVIQRYIKTEWHGVSGYANSRVDGVPALMEIVSEHGRNFVNRSQLDKFIALDPYDNEIAFEQVHHYPPDRNKTCSTTLCRLAQLTLIIERVYGRDVQIEFAEGREGLRLVQVRPLPHVTHEDIHIVEFPDIDEYYAGAAIGVGDLILDMLGSNRDNSENDGAVVFNRNEMWSMIGNKSGLPKTGAVIILFNTGSNGHIQTMCSERGLICVYPQSGITVERNGTYFDHDSAYEPKKVRIVANGMEGRVYIVV